MNKIRVTFSDKTTETVLVVGEYMLDVPNVGDEVVLETPVATTYIVAGRRWYPADNDVTVFVTVQ